MPLPKALVEKIRRETAADQTTLPGVQAAIDALDMQAAAQVFQPRPKVESSKKTVLAVGQQRGDLNVLIVKSPEET